MSVDANYLKKFRCFETLTDKQREAVAALADAECFYAGHTLFQEDDSGDFLYLLADGEVEVLYNIGEGGLTNVDTLGAGEIAGCSALIAPYLHTSTTRSLTNVDVLAIDAAALRQLMRDDCPLGFAIQQHLIELFIDRTISFRLES